MIVKLILLTKAIAAKQLKMNQVDPTRRDDQMLPGFPDSFANDGFTKDPYASPALNRMKFVPEDAKDVRFNPRDGSMTYNKSNPSFRNPSIDSHRTSSYARNRNPSIVRDSNSSSIVRDSIPSVENYEQKNDIPRRNSIYNNNNESVVSGKTVAQVGALATISQMVYSQMAGPSPQPQIKVMDEKIIPTSAEEFRGILNSVSEFFLKVYRDFMIVFLYTLDGVANLLSNWVESLKPYLTALYDLAKPYLDVAKEYLLNFYEVIRPYLQSAYEYISNLYTLVVPYVKSAYNYLYTLMAPYIGSVVVFLTEMIKSMKESLTVIFSTVLDALKPYLDALSKCLSSISSYIDNLIKYLTGLSLFSFEGIFVLICILCTAAIITFGIAWIRKVVRELKSSSIKKKRTNVVFEEDVIGEENAVDDEENTIIDEKRSHVVDMGKPKSYYMKVSDDFYNQNKDKFKTVRNISKKSSNDKNVNRISSNVKNNIRNNVRSLGSRIF